MHRLTRLVPHKVRLVVSSIRFRLALWFAAILAVVLVAFSAFVYARQVQDLNNQALNRLGIKARQWEASLKYGARDYFENRRALSLDGGAEEYGLLQENDILALVGLQGEVVQKVGPVADDDLQALANFQTAESDYKNPYAYRVIEATAEGRLIQENYLFVVAPISTGGRVIGSLIVGSPVDPNGQLDRLRLTLLLGNLATLGLALAGGYWLADRAMRPVKTITRAAREIGETDLSRRLNLATRDELGELAGTFDGMLSRLQAAFDRQRQFTADASHELRTPLTIVNLETSRALAQRRTVQEYERALTVIRAENELMTRLVNNLLILSRMDAGQAVFEFEELDLSDLALDVVERLTGLAERRGVSLSSGELPELKVSGDRQYLSQMIANLVENAIKYARRDGDRADPQVHVETGLSPDGKNGLVSVADNGPGIAPENLPYIFDRFYQVDRARTRNEEETDGDLPGGQVSTGSGLGLSIVQKIAHAHGGEVFVQSEIDRGTIFTVRLPLAG